MEDEADSILEFAFNNNYYSFAGTGMEDEALHEVLRQIKVALNLSESVALAVRTEPGRPFLDETLKLSEVLRMLADSASSNLEICIDLSPFASERAVTKGKAKSKGPQTNWDPKRQPDGSINLQIESTFQRDLIHYENTYVLLPALMLRQFQGHLKSDSMARWINRLCGSVLGASITIVVALQNTGIHEIFRSNLKLALFFCLFCTIAFGLLEVFGRPKDRRSLEALIDSLLKGARS
jgi:hypothetical protein